MLSNEDRVKAEKALEKVNRFISIFESAPNVKPSEKDALFRARRVRSAIELLLAPKPEGETDAEFEKRFKDSIGEIYTGELLNKTGQRRVDS